jgi:arylsulfatase A-like enzyme
MDAPQDPLVQQIADEVERRFNARFDQAEERLEKRLDERLEIGLKKATDELKHQAKLNKEELADQIKKAADGYAASLESIDRKLDALHSKWDTQIADHHAALENHARRISALEQNRIG